MSSALISFLAIFTAYALIWLPFKRHESEKIRHEARIAGLQQKLQEHENSRNHELVEHDRTVFKRLDAIADEVKLSEFISRLIATYEYKTRDFGTFFRFLREFGQKTEDQFLIETLREKFIRFHISYDELIQFMGETFTQVYADEGRALFNPTNIPKRKPEDLHETLRRLHDNVKAAYADFRGAVKTTLFL